MVTRLTRWWGNRHYVSPFRHSERLEVGRVDMGVDYHGIGRIDAIGRCKIMGLGGVGWPGGHYLHYKLLRGRHRGRHVYVAEAIRPTVRVGQTVRRGHRVAIFAAGAAPGMSPGIEIGWSSEITNLTLAAQTEQPLPPDHANTEAGKAFARFLHNHGAPAPVVPFPRGREYPV